MKEIYIFDFEVFKLDWLVVIKRITDCRYWKLHNDPESLKDFLDCYDPILCGFNNKGYDNHILKAIVSGCSNDEIKQVNNYLIKGGNGWECPVIANLPPVYFDSFDLMDDCQMGLSLKAIEGHLGMDIRESKIDFNIDRKLTDAEVEETFYYCTHDVDATHELLKLRKNYLETKMNLGQMVGISEIKSLYMTNAKLTAAYLKAKAPSQPRTDEREYTYPTNLLRQYVPPEVFEHFDKIHDLSIPSEVYFKTKLDLVIGGCQTRIAFGGIHGAIPTYAETETETRIIRNYDVASYYPHLMTIMGYTSRNIPDPKIYEEMLEKRMAAKKSGDKVTANALKLVANTTYGASLNRYNDLYDPLMGRSVCITGQLFLLEMANHLIDECSTVKIIQLNTDGIMISFEKTEYDKVLEITKEWQDRTGFELEEDEIRAIYQKDVNNYVEIASDGSKKIKGGYLVRGVAPAGAFNVNNNAKAVAKAVAEYFASGTPVEQTINEDEDIHDFQLIAKASSKYKEAFYECDGENVPIQKVNRVYATDNPRFGKLVKVKAETDAEAKIASLPEHCLIDNDNHLTIRDVYKGWYIDLAKKQINDFMGIKPEKKGKTTMAATSTTKAPMNVYSRLLKARRMFLDAHVKQSGKNNALEFQYFELSDIIPVLTPVCEEVGLLFIFSMSEDIATLTAINTDAPDDTIVFTMPYTKLSTNRGTNEMQALGASQTYMRRYLYLNALDIVVNDEVEPTLTTAPFTPVKVEEKKPTPTLPVTKAEREEIKKELTNADGAADELQLKQLKMVMKDILTADPSKQEMLNQIAVATEGFTKLTKTKCEELLVQMQKMKDGMQ